MQLFRFAQLEYPWPLGPPDGRYLLRTPGPSGGAEPTHVVVLATLGAPERRRLTRRRHKAQPEPDAAPVATGRATVINLGSPFTDKPSAARWLAGAGESELEPALAVLNRALHAFRLASADAYVHPLARRQALVARLGFGAGEEVAEGRWSDARELRLRARRQSRATALQPQARLAALLGGRDHGLVSEELVLRARLDLDQDREREAALQVLVGLDAAIAELQADPAADALAERLQELRERRDPTAQAAQSALAGALTQDERQAVELTLGRIEAALRARVAAGG